MKYRKKPVEVEAIQWTGENLDTLRLFVPEEHRSNKVGEQMGIKTLEGVMKIPVGDYVIKGIEGEYYPCKPSIFEKTYERSEDIKMLTVSDQVEQELKRYRKIIKKHLEDNLSASSSSSAVVVEYEKDLKEYRRSLSNLL